MAIVKYVAFTLIAALVILVAMFYYASNLGLGNGYKMHWQPFETAHLASETTIAVEPTVFSVDFFEDYVAGLRIASTHFDCRGERFTQYDDQESFFIVNTQSHERMDFVSRSEFEDQLAVLGIADKIFMDFESFYRIANSLRDEQPSASELLICEKIEVSLDDK